MDRRSLITLALLTAIAAAVSAPSIRAADPAAPADPAKNPAHKSPIPTAADLKSADAMLHEVYKDDLAAATTPALKTGLAVRILAAAAAEPHLPQRYALLLAARDQAFAAADPKAMLAAIAALDKDFDIDALKLEFESLVSLSHQMKTLEQRASLAAGAEFCAKHAVGAENFDIARQMADLAVSFASGGDATVIKDATAYAAAVRDFQSVAADAKHYLPLLAANPTDPEANFRVGKYRCLYKGAWREGLVNLAMGSDKKLGALAQKDIATPANPDAQMETGDTWWDLAQDSAPIVKNNLLARARFYYFAALPRIQGLGEARIEKRLKETQDIQTPAVPDAGNIVLEILNQIPVEFRPLKTDTDAEVIAKYAGLKRWITDHPQFGIVSDPKTSFIAKFAGAATYTTSAHPVTAPDPFAPAPIPDNTENMRLRITFQDTVDFNGIPCLVTFSASRAITGPNDPEIANTKKFQVGTNYKIDTQIASSAIAFLRRTFKDPVTGASEITPAIGLQLGGGSQIHIGAAPSPDPATRPNK